MTTYTTPPQHTRSWVRRSARDKDGVSKNTRRRSELGVSATLDPIYYFSSKQATNNPSPLQEGDKLALFSGFLFMYVCIWAHVAVPIYICVTTEYLDGEIFYYKCLINVVYDASTISGYALQIID